MATIVLTFTASIPPPAKGYIIKYRELGAPVYNTVSPNPMSSPVQIEVPSGKRWEGTIQAKCSDTSPSAPIAWTADGVGSPNLNPFNARFAGSEAGVCAATPATYYSPDIGINGDPVTGSHVYFDSSGLAAVGDGFITDSVGNIFGVQSGIVGVPTGNTC